MDIILQPLINGIMMGGIYALLAMGLTVVFGIIGLVNFTHGDFAMIGAFLVYLFINSFHMNFWVALLLAIGCGILIGVVMNKIFSFTLGKYHMNGLIVSIGLMMLLQNTAMEIWRGAPRTIEPMTYNVLHILGANIALQRIIILGISLLMMGAFWFFLIKTKVGRATRAVAMDAEVARLVGIKVERVILINFIVAVILAVVAGSLMGTLIPVHPFMGAAPTMKAFIVTIVGSLGNPLGAVIGGFLIGLAESFGAQFISAGYQDAFGFIVLIIVLLIRPQGLFGGSAIKWKDL